MFVFKIRHIHWCHCLTDFLHKQLQLKEGTEPASRPALGPTQPPIQWVPGVLSPGVKHGRGVTLTTHPHIVPRLKGAVPPLPPCAFVACSGTALLLLLRTIPAVLLLKPFIAGGALGYREPIHPLCP
jgi:hypothetical protein